MTHYYLHNAKTEEFIMECSEKELDVIKKNYEVVEERHVSGKDGYGNEFNCVNVLINIE